MKDDLNIIRIVISEYFMAFHDVESYNQTRVEQVTSANPRSSTKSLRGTFLSSNQRLEDLIALGDGGQRDVMLDELRELMAGVARTRHITGDREVTVVKKILSLVEGHSICTVAGRSLVPMELALTGVGGVLKSQLGAQHIAAVQAALRRTSVK